MIAPEIIWPFATLVLGLATGYGLFRYATRDKSKDRRTEEATRRLYNTPTRDDLDR